jgi:hypothetical protein
MNSLTFSAVLCKVTSSLWNVDLIFHVFSFLVVNYCNFMRLCSLCNLITVFFFNTSATKIEFNYYLPKTRQSKARKFLASVQISCDATPSWTLELVKQIYVIFNGYSAAKFVVYASEPRKRASCNVLFPEIRLRTCRKADGIAQLV